MRVRSCGAAAASCRCCVSIRMRRAFGVQLGRRQAGRGRQGQPDGGRAGRELDRHQLRLPDPRRRAARHGRRSHAQVGRARSARRGDDRGAARAGDGQAAARLVRELHRARGRAHRGGGRSRGDRCARSHARAALFQGRRLGRDRRGSRPPVRCRSSATAICSRSTRSNGGGRRAASRRSCSGAARSSSRGSSARSPRGARSSRTRASGSASHWKLAGYMKAHFPRRREGAGAGHALPALAPRLLLPLPPVPA